MSEFGVVSAMEMLREMEETDAALLEKGMRLYDLHPVLRQFGTWAVTEYGVECLARYYPIAMERLYEDGSEGWPLHMAGKRWVDMSDFLEALYWARCRLVESRRAGRRARQESERTTGRGLGLRFEILRRDGYRCQLCGRSAKDGVILEVDHKHPRAKGGKGDRSNLWTLCFECNRGKLDRDL